MRHRIETGAHGTLAVLALAALVACGGDDGEATDTGAVDTDLTGDTLTTGGPGDTGPTTGGPTDTAPGTDTGAPTGPDGLAIVGTYTDDWGSTHEITETTWSYAYPGYPADVFHISAYDNDGRWVVAQNDAGNAWNPEQWSRFDWYDDGAALYYCQTAFAAASEADAIATPAADSSDLAGGCGGFAWTGLSP